MFRLHGADGLRYAGKVYFKHPSDGRNRQAVEYGALEFLRDHRDLM